MAGSSAGLLLLDPLGHDDRAATKAVRVDPAPVAPATAFDFPIPIVGGPATSTAGSPPTELNLVELRASIAPRAPTSASPQELFALACDPDPNRAFEAADAVARLLRSAEGSDLLAANLSNLPLSPRGWAVDLAGAEGGPQHRTILRKALDDPSEGVRERAQLALRALDVRVAQSVSSAADVSTSTLARVEAPAALGSAPPLVVESDLGMDMNAAPSSAPASPSTPAPSPTTALDVIIKTHRGEGAAKARHGDLLFHAEHLPFTDVERLLAHAARGVGVSLEQARASARLSLTPENPDLRLLSFADAPDPFVATAGVSNFHAVFLVEDKHGLLGAGAERDDPHFVLQLVLEVLTSDLQVLRTVTSEVAVPRIQNNGPVAVAVALGWDGRDDAGELITQGTFTYDLRGELIRVSDAHSTRHLLERSETGIGTLEVILDTTPPQVTIVAPAATGAVVGPSFNIMAQVVDPEPLPSGVDVATIRVFIDDVDRTSLAQVRPDGLTLNVGALALLEGTHTIRVEASDKARNRATADSSFVLDATPPQLSPFVVGLVAGTFTGDATPDVGAQIADAIAGVNLATVTITIDGAPLALQFTPGEVRATSGPLAEGPHTVVAQAADAVGNQTVAQTVFTLDLTPATVQFVEPGALSKDPRPSVRLTFEDVLSGTDAQSLLLLVNGAPAPAGTFTQVTAGEASGRILADLPEGSNQLEARLRDRVGNIGSASSQVFVDSRSPSVTLSPAEGAVVSPLVAFDVAFVDPQPGTGIDETTVRIFVDGVDRTAEFAVSSGRATLSLGEANALEVGDHEMQAIVHDRLGNQTVAVAHFTVSLAGFVPRPEIDPLPFAASNRTIVTLTGSALPGATIAVLDSGVSLGVPVQVDGAGRWTFTSPALLDAVHVFTAKATDAEGHASAPSRSVSVIIDTVPAALAFLPGNGAVGLGSLVVTFDDGPLGSGIVPDSFRGFVDSVDRTAEFALASGEAVFGGVLDRADHTLDAEITDLAGNTTRIVGAFGGPPRVLFDGDSTIALQFSSPLTPASFTAPAVTLNGAPVDVTAELVGPVLLLRLGVPIQSVVSVQFGAGTTDLRGRPLVGTLVEHVTPASPLLLPPIIALSATYLPSFPFIGKKVDITVKTVIIEIKEQPTPGAGTGITIATRPAEGFEAILDLRPRLVLVEGRPEVANLTFKADLSIDVADLERRAPLAAATSEATFAVFARAHGYGVARATATGTFLGQRVSSPEVRVVVTVDAVNDHLVVTRAANGTTIRAGGISATTVSSAAPSLFITTSTNIDLPTPLKFFGLTGSFTGQVFNTPGDRTFFLPADGLYRMTVRDGENDPGRTLLVRQIPGTTPRTKVINSETGETRSFNVPTPYLDLGLLLTLNNRTDLLDFDHVVRVGAGDTFRVSTLHSVARTFLTVTGLAVTDLSITTTVAGGVTQIGSTLPGTFAAQTVTQADGGAEVNVVVSGTINVTFQEQVFAFPFEETRRIPVTVFGLATTPFKPTDDPITVLLGEHVDVHLQVVPPTLASNPDGANNEFIVFDEHFVTNVSGPENFGSFRGQVVSFQPTRPGTYTVVTGSLTPGAQSARFLAQRTVLVRDWNVQWEPFHHEHGDGTEASHPVTATKSEICAGDTILFRATVRVVDPRDQNGDGQPDVLPFPFEDGKRTLTYRWTVTPAGDPAINFRRSDPPINRIQRNVGTTDDAAKNPAAVVVFPEPRRYEVALEVISTHRDLRIERTPGAPANILVVKPVLTVSTADALVGDLVPVTVDFVPERPSQGAVAFLSRYRADRTVEGRIWADANRATRITTQTRIPIPQVGAPAIEIFVEAPLAPGARGGGTLEVLSECLFSDHPPHHFNASDVLLLRYFEPHIIAPQGDAAMDHSSLPSRDYLDIENNPGPNDGNERVFGSNGVATVPCFAELRLPDDPAARGPETLTRTRLGWMGDPFGEVSGTQVDPTFVPDRVQTQAGRLRGDLVYDTGGPLPQLNADFGPHVVRLAILDPNGNHIPDSVKEARVELFYDAAATNHPGPSHRPSADAVTRPLRAPNWVHYWIQAVSTANGSYLIGVNNGKPAVDIRYGEGIGSGVLGRTAAITHWREHRARRNLSVREIWIYDGARGVSAFGWPNTNRDESGIDSVVNVVLHEQQHVIEIILADATLAPFAEIRADLDIRARILAAAGIQQFGSNTLLDGIFGQGTTFYSQGWSWDQVVKSRTLWG